jgi:hypothetical protein
MICVACVADRAAAGAKEQRQGRAEIKEREAAAGNSTFAFDGLPPGAGAAVRRGAGADARCGCQGAVHLSLSLSLSLSL